MHQRNRQGSGRRRAGGMAVVTALALSALPAAANAAIKVYAGTTAGGGEVAMDVKIKQGKPKTITEIRYQGVPAACTISGPLAVWGNTPRLDLRVSKKGKFSGKLSQPVYGNVTSISGKFKGKGRKLATGTFTYSYHFEADAEYPEEDCSNPGDSFKVTKGAPDLDPGPPTARR